MQERVGFVPNVFLTLAHRPEEFRALFAYHEALMNRDGLTQAEKEMVIVATSADNNCLYCVVAHGAVLGIRAKNALIADQLATNYRKADVSGRHRALLDFALKVSHDATGIEETDFEALRGHGFDNEMIWEIAGITAFFGLSNRMANLTSIRPNDEFYAMSR